MTRLPNFLYIGPDKAGSSWLHEVLLAHPQVFMTPAKDLYFFDRYFDKGVDWYAGHFERAGDEQVVGEVCQDYLFHPEAAERIQKTLESPRFMVTLRDPVDRAFSSYLYMLKMGQQPGSFGEALTSRPELVEHGRYGAGLDRFADRFGDDSIYVSVFDDLQADAAGYVAALLSWMQLDPMELTDELLQARLPASAARSAPIARLARAAADWTREHNGAEVVGRVKRSSLVQRLLYRPLERKPEAAPADVARVRELLDDDVRRVEERFGVALRSRWGWT
ncbi:MAG TPA: sulfotransferase [Actinomycetales bacterium]|nr:sulfotransferase [Actinomycetales bacterium]